MVKSISGSVVGELLTGERSIVEEGSVEGVHETSDYCLHGLDEANLWISIRGFPSLVVTARLLDQVGTSNWHPKLHFQHT
jgi:hypothetical protein